MAKRLSLEGRLPGVTGSITFGAVLSSCDGSVMPRSVRLERMVSERKDHEMVVFELPNIELVSTDLCGVFLGGNAVAREGHRFFLNPNSECFWW